MWAILSIGNKHPKWLELALSLYQKRCQHPFSIEYSNIPPSKSQTDSKALIKLIPKKSYVIGLDVSSKHFTSEEFARSIEKIHLEHNNITFILGGALGLDHEIKKHCQQLWSLSSLTFTHKLANLILAEQLYRCSCILTNHPYHK